MTTKVMTLARDQLHTSALLSYNVYQGRSYQMEICELSNRGFILISAPDE